jgi:hypothetical protein
MFAVLFMLVSRFVGEIKAPQFEFFVMRYARRMSDHGPVFQPVTPEEDSSLIQMHKKGKQSLCFPAVQTKTLIAKTIAIRRAWSGWNRSFRLNNGQTSRQSLLPL